MPVYQTSSYLFAKPQKKKQAIEKERCTETQALSQTVSIAAGQYSYIQQVLAGTPVVLTVFILSVSPFKVTSAWRTS